jgi:hypothetical protein
MQTASEQGHSTVVAWSHEQGCELIPIEIAFAAVWSNSVPILQYLIANGAVFAAEELTNLLDESDEYRKLNAAVWLRDHGAQWPRSLNKWQQSMIAWACEQGCKSRKRVNNMAYAH